MNEACVKWAQGVIWRKFVFYMYFMPDFDFWLGIRIGVFKSLVFG